MESVYDKVKNIHYLLDYMPYEDKYGLYSTNIIFACNKIVDIYQTCCAARANLNYMNSRDYGDLARDDISKLYIKTLFLQNALFYYNFSVDLSWQIIWLHYDPFITDKIPNNKLYEKCIKNCNYENLRLRLTLARDIKMRKYYLESFYNNPLFREIRELYNFIKHRGAVYFPGLGLNDTKMSFSICDYNVPMVSRRVVKIEELSRKLIEFDNIFVKYLLDIIDILIPDDYLNSGDLLKSMLNYWVKYRDQLQKFNKNSGKY